MRRLTDTQAFKNALKNSAKQTAAAAKNLFNHPLSSLRDAPEGARRFFGRIGDTIRGDEGDESQDGKLAGAIGVSDAKRLQDYRMVEGVLSLLDENGTLIVPLSLDYLQWTESVSNVMEKFVNPSPHGPEIKGSSSGQMDNYLSERKRN